MNLRLGVLRFVRDLSVDRSERRRLAGATVKLLRQRRRSLTLLGPLLRFAPTSAQPKLKLWQNLSRSSSANRLRWASADEPSAVAAAIRSTQAYTDAAMALSQDRNGFLQRSTDYRKLRSVGANSLPNGSWCFITMTVAGCFPKAG